MRNVFSLRFMTFLCLATFISGCQTFGNRGDEATQVIDQGIAEINENHTQWASVLQRVSRQLPEGVDVEIREEAQRLATRSVVPADTSFQCSGDFLGTRAVQGLQRIQGMLVGTSPPTSLPPALCLVTPSEIDLSTDLSTWETVTIHGYDLDQGASEDNLITFFFMNEDHSVVQPIPEALIERVSHSQITLHLQELAEKLHTQNIYQIVPSWTGDLEGTISGEILVKPWTAGRDTMMVELEKTTLVPPHVSGDLDFHVGPKRPMYGFVSANIHVEGKTIKGQVHMNGRQQKGDKTHVEGHSEYVLWDALPDNWKIIRVLPNHSSKRPYFITKKGLNTFTQPAGQIVNRFNIYGDHKGNDANGYTRVEVDWRPVSIEIEETRPGWYFPEQGSVNVPPKSEVAQ
ncbi:MAG: hypothetical protein VST68_06350 [Nitrospirota bacterium]|nr:hypothetical protein [Nitrospirota bacterium]